MNKGTSMPWRDATGRGVQTRSLESAPSPPPAGSQSLDPPLEPAIRHRALGVDEFAHRYPIEREQQLRVYSPKYRGRQPAGCADTGRHDTPRRMSSSVSRPAARACGPRSSCSRQSVSRSASSRKASRIWLLRLLPVDRTRQSMTRASLSFQRTVNTADIATPCDEPCVSRGHDHEERNTRTAGLRRDGLLAAHERQHACSAACIGRSRVGVEALHLLAQISLNLDLV